MTVKELREAINFGKEAVARYRREGKPVPDDIIDMLVTLYEQLIDALI